MFNLPNWVYEPLPYLYVGLGIVTTYGLDTLLGKTSGIMLIVAGIIIAYMRHNYRRLPIRDRSARTLFINRMEA